MNMNRIFKVLWSKVRGCYVVAGELANGYGKNGKSKVFKKRTLGVLAILALYTR